MLLMTDIDHQKYIYKKSIKCKNSHAPPSNSLNIQETADLGL